MTQLSDSNQQQPSTYAVAYPTGGGQPRRNRHLLRWLIGGVAGLVVLIVVIAVAASGGNGSGSSPASGTNAGIGRPATFTLHGVFTLADSVGVLNIDDVHCTGMGGYDDIQPGASITITDAAGTTIGLGSLGDGTMVGSGVTRQCQFAVEVPNVPAGKTFYGVEITHRGSVKVSEAQARSGVTLTLGN